MTIAECQVDTIKHIENVRKYIRFVIDKLVTRAVEHDRLKLENPEVELFTEYTPRLALTTYGTPEYQECLDGLRPALDHHYAHYRHHPEHFEKGVNDMNLVDLIEMLCDWKAASLRHNNGNLLKSIETNAQRFRCDEQLKQILMNTAKLLEDD